MLMNVKKFGFVEIMVFVIIMMDYMFVIVKMDGLDNIVKKVCLNYNDLKIS